MTLLLLDPNQLLAHFEYSPIEAEIALGMTDEAAHLNSILEALSFLVNDIAIQILAHLHQLYDHRSSELNSLAATLHAKENEQGGGFLAMIKGNLRLFLSNIATAFKGFLGFQTSAASNPFLAITVADDIDPLASAEMRIDLEVEYASDASQFENLVKDLSDVLCELFARLATSLDQLDSQFSAELHKKEELHRAQEEKNEQGRQAILNFIASIETATQTLHQKGPCTNSLPSSSQ